MPNGSAFTFRGGDAINRRSGSIQRGDFRDGRLPVIVEGNKLDDITTDKSSIRVTVRDYLGTESSVEFRGTGHRDLPIYMSGEPIDASSQEGMIVGKQKARKRRRR